MIWISLYILYLWELQVGQGQNVILQQPEVIGQMKMIQAKEREKFPVEHKAEVSKDEPLYCKVTTEKTNIGQGKTLGYVYRDIGRCVKVPASRSHYSGKMRGCSSKNLCLPSKVTIDDSVLLSGPRTVTSALQCRCMDPTVPCQRVPYLRAYHAGTMNEKTIDVGRCLGKCHAKIGRQACRPVSTTTVNIDGTNGAQCVEKIIKCACTRGCYRVSYKQIFKAQQFDDVTKTNKTMDLVIDVGRCEGGCRHKKKKSSCIYWIKQRSSVGKSRMVCLFKSGKNSKQRCFPRVFKTRKIRADNGGKQTIHIVKRCGCQ